jgi:hypothetical protein
MRHAGPIVARPVMSFHEDKKSTPAQPGHGVFTCLSRGTSKHAPSCPAAITMAAPAPSASAPHATNKWVQHPRDASPGPC